MPLNTNQPTNQPTKSITLSLTKPEHEAALKKKKNSWIYTKLNDTQSNNADNNEWETKQKKKTERERGGRKKELNCQQGRKLGLNCLLREVEFSKCFLVIWKDFPYKFILSVLLWGWGLDGCVSVSYSFFISVFALLTYTLYSLVSGFIRFIHKSDLTLSYFIVGWRHARIVAI